jgi:hypothetical protein
MCLADICQHITWNAELNQDFCLRGKTTTKPSGNFSFLYQTNDNFKSKIVLLYKHR